MDHLYKIGLIVLVWGCRNFNKDVQKAVNRRQDEEFVRGVDSCS